MSKKQKMVHLVALHKSLEKNSEILYQLVGDHAIPDEDVKKYLNPYFEKSTALKSYVEEQVKKNS